jgi:IS30 family transposase
MGTNYTHLEIEERCRLRGLLEMGLGIGEIARRLGRHRTTIHRERSSASTASKATGRTEPSAARGRASPHSFAVQFWAPIAHIFLRGISILWVVKIPQMGMMQVLVRSAAPNTKQSVKSTSWQALIIRM